MKTVKLSEYSKFPKGKEDGEDFARSKIFPELHKTEFTLRIDFDDTYGISYAFLEGLFGFLINSGHFTLKDLYCRLTFKIEEYPHLDEEIYDILVKLDEKNCNHSVYSRSQECFIVC
nr:MAG TPA: protein of unknown function (DUF4325) [Bacteriophage sp.]